MANRLSTQVLYGAKLVPLKQVTALLATETNVGKVADFAKVVEAAKSIDSKNAERRNYWGELVIWSTRRLGELIRQGQEEGRIDSRGGDRKSKSHDATLKLDDIGVTRDQSSRAQKLVDVPEKVIREYAAKEKEADGEVSKAGLIRFIGADGNIKANQNRGVVEWYTPSEHIEAARKVMGSIELDPASSKFAQKIVNASTFYTQKQDGLKRAWSGMVFLNPPFKMPEVEQFILKLCEHFTAGDVPQAVLVTNNNTDTKWWHTAAELASAICFTRGRIKWYNAAQPDCSPTNGQTFFYLGKRAKRFAEVFSHIGTILTPGS